MERRGPEPSPRHRRHALTSASDHFVNPAAHYIAVIS